MINEWNNIDPEIRKSNSLEIFRNSLLKFIRPSGRAIYNIIDPLGIKLLTRLQIGFSHLREHKFRHNFQDTINPLCSCSIEPETTTHFFLRCHFYNAIRITLMNDLMTIDSSIPSIKDEILVDLLLYGNDKFDDKTNQAILSYFCKSATNMEFQS